MDAMSFALSPVNVWRRRSLDRISETNDTKTDCIIAQLSPFTAARPDGRDGSLLTPVVSRTRVASAPPPRARLSAAELIDARDDVSACGLAAADSEF